MRAAAPDRMTQREAAKQAAKQREQRLGSRREQAQKVLESDASKRAAAARSQRAADDIYAQRTRGAIAIQSRVRGRAARRGTDFVRETHAQGMPLTEREKLEAIADTHGAAEASDFVGGCLSALREAPVADAPAVAIARASTTGYSPYLDSVASPAARAMADRAAARSEAEAVRARAAARIQARQRGAAARSHKSLLDDDDFVWVDSDVPESEDHLGNIEEYLRRRERAASAIQARHRGRQDRQFVALRRELRAPAPRHAAPPVGHGATGHHVAAAHVAGRPRRHVAPSGHELLARAAALTAPRAAGRRKSAKSPRRADPLDQAPVLLLLMMMMMMLMRMRMMMMMVQSHADPPSQALLAVAFASESSGKAADSIAMRSLPAVLGAARVPGVEYLADTTPARELLANVRVKFNEVPSTTQQQKQRQQRLNSGAPRAGRVDRFEASRVYGIRLDL